MSKFAHYFASGRNRVVVISDTTRPVGAEYPVNGKKQAREIAAAVNATCWNF